MVETAKALSVEERARFIEALKQDEEFRDSVRTILLTAELIELPERLAQFMEYVDAFIAEQRVFNAKTEQFIAEQRVFNDEQRAFNAATTASIERLENKFDRMTDDIGILKGNAVITALRAHIEYVLDSYELELDETLGQKDLTAMIRQSGLRNDMSVGDRQSFRLADLVVRCIDQDGGVLYIVAEASYTADRRDSDRAQRNAEYLTRFTGLPAEALVVSVRNDHYVQDLVDKGEIKWFEINEKMIQPD